jgi:SAM-dependent methyltransferase
MTDFDYHEPADPRDFAPDFRSNPEPYGNPVLEALELFADYRDLRILDVAGGYGRYAIPLIKSGHHVTIIDCHVVSLREAERRASEVENGNLNLLTIDSDVLRAEIPATDCNAALCIGFMHHLPEHEIRRLFVRFTAGLPQGAPVVIEISTEKDRRLPSGRPILVDGFPEHNLSLSKGLELISELYSETFHSVRTETIVLRERQPDFWYDARMILAIGTKSV